MFVCEDVLFLVYSSAWMISEAENVKQFGNLNETKMKIDSMVILPPSCRLSFEVCF